MDKPKRPSLFKEMPPKATHDPSKIKSAHREWERHKANQYHHGRKLKRLLDEVTEMAERSR